MADDLRTRFGADLLAVCNEDPERVDHDLSCLTVSADGRFAWAVGSTLATCLEIATMGVVHRVARAARGRVIAAHACDDDPLRATVVYGNGAVTDLRGGHRGIVERGIGAARFAPDGRTLATGPGVNSVSRAVAVWSLAPWARLRYFASEALFDLSDDGAVVLHALAGGDGVGLGFTRVSDGFTRERVLPAKVRAAVLLDAARAAALAGEDLVRVSADPTEPTTVTRPRENAVGLLRAGARFASRHLARGGETLVRDDGASRFLGSRPHLHALLTPDAEGVVACSRVGGNATCGYFTGELRSRGGGHDDPCALAWSPGGGALASFATDGTVVVWDAATGAPRTRLEVGDVARSGRVAWSPEGRALLVVSGDGALTELSLDDGWPHWQHESVCDPLGLRRVAVSPDGAFVAVGVPSLRVYPRGAAEPCFTLDDGETHAFAWHADHPATLIAVHDADPPETPVLDRRKAWSVIRVDRGEVLGRRELDAMTLQLADDGRDLWSGTFAVLGDNRLSVTDPLDGQRVGTEARNGMMVTANGGALLVTHPADGTLTVVRREGRARTVPWTFTDDAPRVVSPDGTRLAVASRGRIAIVALP